MLVVDARWHVVAWVLGALAVAVAVMAVYTLVPPGRWRRAPAATTTTERFSEAGKDDDAVDSNVVAVHESRSHKIEVTDTPDRGTCVSVDGRVQFCSRDEHVYHEMLVHFPTQYIPGASPKRVLIASGGDCLALREVLKYPEIKEVVVLERDEGIVAVSENHLLLSARRDDKRVTWLFGDNPTELLVRLRNQSEGRRIRTGATFDLIIVDRKERPGMDGYGKDEFYKEARLLLSQSGVLVRNGLQHQAALAAIFGHTLSYAFKVGKGGDKAGRDEEGGIEEGGVEEGGVEEGGDEEESGGEEVIMVIAANFVLKAHVVDGAALSRNKVNARFYKPDEHASHLRTPSSLVDGGVLKKIGQALNT